jgi:excisionase family DNA binding protein
MSEQSWQEWTSALQEDVDDIAFAEGVELPPLVPDFVPRRHEATRGRPAGEPLASVPLSAIEMRSIEWLEKPLWQRSAFQLLAGPKGSGKGTYLAGLAARISRTGANVVFVSTEDSASIDLKPRLVAAEADIDRCTLITQHVHLPNDVERLHALAESVADVGLIVVDPVANHIGDVKPGDDVKVRHAIAPLNKLADDLGCLIIGVRHPGKDRTRGAVASVLGSTAWVDTPRAVVMIAVDDEDERVRHIQVVAGNRSRNGVGQVFRIDAVEVPGLAEPITLAVALGESSKPVDELLSTHERSDSRSARARELILDLLEGEGDQESDALDARVAAETGLKAGTVKNVRIGLKDDGLVKMYPDKDEHGAILRWNVGRTAATAVIERLLTARELAAYLGLSPATVLDKWERGELPGFKFGRAVRFDLEEVLALGRRGPGTGGEVSPTPTAHRPRGLLSQLSPTPQRGGQDAS